MSRSGLEIEPLAWAWQEDSLLQDRLNRNESISDVLSGYNGNGMVDRFPCVEPRFQADSLPLYAPSLNLQWFLRTIFFKNFCITKIILNQRKSRWNRCMTFSLSRFYYQKTVFDVQIVLILYLMAGLCLINIYRRFNIYISSAGPKQTYMPILCIWDLSGHL